MTWPQRIALLAAGLVLLGATLWLIRSRHLREPYSVVWVCVAIGLMVFFIMPDSLLSVAGWLGIDQIILVLMLVVAFLVGVAIHFSVVMMRQADRQRALSQEVAILKDELFRVRTESREAPPPLPEPKPKPPSLRT